jgi:type I restriction enzyme S subunit
VGMSDWRDTDVSSIASSVRNALVGGPFGSNLVSNDYIDHGVPVIRGQNMGSRWVSGKFAYVSTEKAKSLEANLAKPGDIIFTQRGTLGQVAIVPKEPFDYYVVSQSQMKLTPDHSKADPLFLYYVVSFLSTARIHKTECYSGGSATYQPRNTARYTSNTTTIN